MDDPSGASPGAILKRCREYHGLTLEEAEQSTKIGANYLNALEEDQIGQFASLAYLKGFLRIYAAYLGLNPDDMIRLYDRLYASGNGRADHKGSAAESSEKPHRKRFPLQKLALPAVLLLLILICAAIVNRSSAPPVRPNQAAQVAASPAAPATQQMHSSARPARTADGASDGQSRGAAPVAPPAGAQKADPEIARGFIVRLKATHSGTLNVIIDGFTSQAYDLTVGDSIEWKADRTISLELSNSGGVEAELNGRLLKPFGPNGKPAVIVLDSEGVRQ
jgi:cytoskeleton protein RodZ